jgi:hypothetical protein
VETEVRALRAPAARAPRRACCKEKLFFAERTQFAGLRVEGDTVGAAQGQLPGARHPDSMVAHGWFCAGRTSLEVIESMGEYICAGVANGVGGEARARGQRAVARRGGRDFRGRAGGSKEAILVAGKPILAPETASSTGFERGIEVLAEESGGLADFRAEGQRHTGATAWSDTISGSGVILEDLRVDCGLSPQILQGQLGTGRVHPMQPVQKRLCRYDCDR